MKGCLHVLGEWCLSTLRVAQQSEKPSSSGLQGTILLGRCSTGFLAVATLQSRVDGRFAAL